MSVFAVGFDFRDTFEVNDIGTVDAQEARGIERGFEIGDGLLLQMLFASRHQADIVVSRFRVLELAHQRTTAKLR